MKTSHHLGEPDRDLIKNSYSKFKKSSENSVLETQTAQLRSGPNTGYMKGFSTSLIIKGMQIKTAMWCHSNLLEWLFSKR